MQKRNFWLVLLTFLLLAVPLQAGVAHAQEEDFNNFTIQYFVTDSLANYIGFVQGISGIVVPNFSGGGQVNVSFNNVTVTGLYNASYGIGSYRNQGSLAFVNLQPNVALPPPLFLGVSLSQNNDITISDYNYSLNLNFNGFKGSGIVVLNMMAASFSNQFTAVHLSMGRNVAPPPSPIVTNFTEDTNSKLVTLTSAQMQTIAATANDDIKIQGKQSAVATVKGTPEVQGICAMTLSSGVNNLVIHRVGINIDTAP